MTPTDSHEKICSLEELGHRCAELCSLGRTIVHCHGVFDLLHIGHIKHFQAAKKLGDTLVVTLTPDRHVNKGPGRPAFSELLRAEAIAALAAVDLVAINTSASAMTALEASRPTIYAKGSDYKDRIPTAGSKLQGEIDLVRSYGGDIAFTDEPQSSSSKLINQTLSPYSIEVREQLATVRAAVDPGEIQRLLSSLEQIEAEVEVESKYHEVLQGLFPKITISERPQSQTTARPSALDGKHLQITAAVGVTSITAQSLKDPALGAALATLSPTNAPLDVLVAAASILDKAKLENPYLATFFLVVLAQEIRPGLTLASLRKVMESILK